MSSKETLDPINKLFKYQTPETPYQAVILGSVCLQNALNVMEDIAQLEAQKDMTQDLKDRMAISTIIENAKKNLEAQIVSIEKHEKTYNKLLDK